MRFPPQLKYGEIEQRKQKWTIIYLSINLVLEMNLKNQRGMDGDVRLTLPPVKIHFVSLHLLLWQTLGALMSEILSLRLDWGKLCPERRLQGSVFRIWWMENLEPSVSQMNSFSVGLVWYNMIRQRRSALVGHGKWGGRKEAIVVIASYTFVVFAQNLVACSLAYIWLSVGRLRWKSFTIPSLTANCLTVLEPSWSVPVLASFD